MKLYRSELEAKVEALKFKTKEQVFKKLKRVILGVALTLTVFNSMQTQTFAKEPIAQDTMGIESIQEMLGESIQVIDVGDKIEYVNPSTGAAMTKDKSKIAQIMSRLGNNIQVIDHGDKTEYINPITGAAMMEEKENTNVYDTNIKR